MSFTLYLQLHLIKSINLYTRGVYVYLNKFEIAVSHIFLIIFSNNKFSLVNPISRNAQPPRKYLLALFAGLKQSLKTSGQNLSV